MEVLEFCKSHNIEYSWDFSRRDKTKWTDVLINGKAVVQFQDSTTVQQFKEVIRLLMEDFHREDFEAVSSDDFWFNVGDEKSFKEFIAKYKELFDDIN